MTFERARQPEHKEQRRTAILTAAAELFDTEGLHAVSLSAIARRSKVSKANIYRYFESREAIYLAILGDEYERLAGHLEGALAPLAGSSDVDAVAQAVGRAFTRFPRLSRLTAFVGSVLEQNVSVDGVRAFKERTGLVLLRYINALHAAVPRLDIAACESAVRFIALYAGGVYHAAHPGTAVRTLQQEPAFQWTCIDFEETVRSHTRAILRGLMA